MCKKGNMVDEYNCPVLQKLFHFSLCIFIWTIIKSELDNHRNGLSQIIDPQKSKEMYFDINI